MNYKNNGHSLAFYERRNIFSSFVKKQMLLLWHSLDFCLENKRRKREENMGFFFFSIYQLWECPYILNKHYILKYILCLYFTSPNKIFSMCLWSFFLFQIGSFLMKLPDLNAVITQSIYQVNYYSLKLIISKITHQIMQTNKNG